MRPVPRFPEHGLGVAPCASPRWHGPARRFAGPGQPAEGAAPPRYLQPGVGRLVGIVVRQTRGYCRERRGATRWRTGTATVSTGVFTRAGRRGAGCGRPRSKRVGYRQLRSLRQLRRRTGARGAGGRPADLAGRAGGAGVRLPAKCVGSAPCQVCAVYAGLSPAATFLGPPDQPQPPALPACTWLQQHRTVISFPVLTLPACPLPTSAPTVPLAL